MLPVHFEPKLMKIGRIELELFRSQKWTHKKKHPVFKKTCFEIDPSWLLQFLMEGGQEGDP